MNNNSVPKADGIKLDETKCRATWDTRGVRPIRKRGFHRALNRKEFWAVDKHNEMVMLKSITDSLFYGGQSIISANWQNDLISLKDHFGNQYESWTLDE